MRTRVGAVLVALLAALLVAACGGGGGGSKPSSSGGGSVPAGADFAPMSAPGFVSVATDVGGSQWKAADDLLKKFPGRAQLIGLIEKSLAKQQLDFEQDIKPALGPETDIGILRFKGSTGNAVVAAQPQDESKFTALLNKLATGDKKKPVTRKVGDWTLASDSQVALDAAAAAHDGSSLQDNAVFKEAMGDLAGDSLVKVWVNGAALSGLAKGRTGGTGSLSGFGKLVSLAVALEARKDGAFLQAVVKSDQDLPISEYTSKLAKQVPAGVLAYLSFNGLDKAIQSLGNVPAVKAQSAKIKQALGVSLEELAPLFAGEGALYVRQGIPLPEITLALEETDTASALSVADKIFRHLAPGLGGQILAATVDGVPVKQVKTSSFSLYYAAFDGKLVVSDSTTSVTGLKDSGTKFADDSLFKDAKDTAGMPDSTAGFFYVNLKDTIPILENLVTSSGRKIPPAVQQNLDPLRSVLFYSTVAGQKATVAGFVGIQ
jgi:hypothetical protein